VNDRLTRRALPDADASIDRLDEAERRFAANYWLRRAAGELASTRGFRWIADACTGLDADPQLIALAERAVRDEDRHGEICRRVATRYHGGEVTPVVPPPNEREPLVPGDPELGVALYIVESCCLSEAIGAVTIEAALRDTTAPLARAALRELLADEVVHARIGWAYVAAPQLGGRYRDAIGERLPDLLRSMFDYWLLLVGEPTPAAARAHGCLPLEGLEDWIGVAFEDIALPGFAHLGIDTRAAAGYLTARRDERRATCPDEDLRER
jgi:hypothetical protein